MMPNIPQENEVQANTARRPYLEFIKGKHVETRVVAFLVTCNLLVR